MSQQTKQKIAYCVCLPAALVPFSLIAAGLLFVLGLVWTTWK